MSVASAIEELARGRMVVLTGGEGRESEGSLVLAAEHTTPAAINFMTKEARGLISLALSAERCDQLGLTPMMRPGEATSSRGFMVSIEAREGVTTGISAHDRARTVLTAIDPRLGAADIVQPGHVLPLRARPGGIYERAGQAEAAIHLARLAGALPAAVVCTILSDDGSAAGRGELAAYARRHGLAAVSVEELLGHRAHEVDAEEMRRAMSHFATGVGVITTRDRDGAPVGTTANAISSVSLEPPLLLVCLARDSLTLAALRASGRFAVNLLADDQRHHSVRFAAKGSDGFAGEVEFHEHEHGVPCLPGALATVSCRLDAVHVAGDHEIVIGEARAVTVADEDVSPLLFFRGSYGELAEARPVWLRAAG